MKTLERKPRSLTAIVDREMKRVGLKQHDLSSLCSRELRRQGVQLAGRSAQQMWDSASRDQRAKWLRSTGSWASDADLTWSELMKEGGSQADVMKELMDDLAGQK